MPCDPLGDNHSRITACERHIQLSRKAASEGAVLLKNNNHLLPFPKGTKIAVFGKAQIMTLIFCSSYGTHLFNSIRKNVRYPKLLPMESTQQNIIRFLGRCLKV